MQHKSFGCTEVFLGKKKKFIRFFKKIFASQKFFLGSHFEDPLGSFNVSGILICAFLSFDLKSAFDVKKATFVQGPKVFVAQMCNTKVRKSCVLHRIFLAHVFGCTKDKMPTSVQPKGGVHFNLIAQGCPSFQSFDSERFA